MKIRIVLDIEFNEAVASVDIDKLVTETMKYIDVMSCLHSQVEKIVGAWYPEAKK